MKSLKQVLNQTVPSMILVREGVCEGCQYPIKVYETKLIGGPRKGERVEVTYGCKCEDIKLAKQAQENKEKRELQRVLEHFDYYSLISKRLKEATLDNYIPQNQSQQIAKESVKKYIEIFSLDNPINLLFIGGYGVGKSHLAKCIADGIMQKENPETKRRYTAIFISVPKLLRKIRSTYNRNSEISEADIFEILEEVDLLVLDDIGAERQNDWTEERLFDIIDSRQGKHTIYTSNYNERDLFDLLGERNFSRIVNEDTKILQIDGENFRLRDLNLA